MLDANDAHHGRAHRVVRQAIADRENLACSPITLAEVLVKPVRSGRLMEEERVLRLLGMTTVALPLDAPPRLALLRVETSMNLPDRCVLMAATGSESALITFDDSLAKAAGRLGLLVVTT